MNIGYEEIFEQIKKWVSGKQVALVDIGDDERDVRQAQKELWESLGIKCDWYYYPKEINREEFWKECKDLKPHYDWLYVPSDNGFEIIKTAYWLPHMIELGDKKVCIVGNGFEAEELGRSLVGKCRELVMTRAEPSRDVDIVFTAKGLNCYSLGMAIVEIGNEECTNIENRNIYSRRSGKPLWDLPFWLLN